MNPEADGFKLVDKQGGEVCENWSTLECTMLLSAMHNLFGFILNNLETFQADLMGGSGGKSCRLAVGGSPVRSHPGCVEMSLSETPNPQLLLTSCLVPCMAANRRWCGNVRMRGIHCTAIWIKVLYKMQSIYH